MMFIIYYGFTEIYFKFNGPKYKPLEVQVQSNDGDVDKIIDLDDILEGVTILRPIKGIDPELEICLESSILQKYPSEKLQIIFCVENSQDPAIPIIEKLIKRYNHLDVELLIDESYEDNHFGPNPKINNLAKGYKMAKFDIIWVLDSNVFVNPGTLLRSIINLQKSIDNGRETFNFDTGKGNKIKIMHHVPLAVSINNSNTLGNLGARLDEMFLFTSHAKFYVFFNKASIAPCVNGKSNIYRKSDLDSSVMEISKGQIPLINNRESIAKAASTFVKTPGEGIRFFSRYIGEDNMIGIALWNDPNNGGRTGMTGDVVIQPIGGSTNNGLPFHYTNKIMDYVNRRVRWLRVRKYMVLAATLVEPTTESLLIGVFGTYGLSNLFFQGQYKKTIMFLHELIWCITDYTQFKILLKFANQDKLHDNQTISPYFINDHIEEKYKLINWLPIWILREILALPIWIMAMCGTEIDWRNRPFKIRTDLCAEEL
ncbi:ceramide glucosyltransferase [Wickerhamomyces ciferrii]|uniref:Ceramide glucosyltransferase n=1 Tax=Wickerhamomyces ciferrii (strain ATCC 14091 / BCRC 22168 / CBS 111 / JCM 3599 / NBRC 0793 / NRRL Y-1031 F-60-10) TaxID=1206466 RepID=K0KNR8_WICCF|nr:ceramide glucosyltransferase [Wickerhamomyces ciferrii]CCH43044.1 ceramide glucosyltransferase [Wickerhamomyces ciferrii]